MTVLLKYHTQNKCYNDISSGNVRINFNSSQKKNKIIDLYFRIHNKIG